MAKDEYVSEEEFYAVMKAVTFVKKIHDAMKYSGGDSYRAVAMLNEYACWYCENILKKQ